MNKVDLSNIGNQELTQWIQDHFYYLPEALASDTPKGYVKDWAKTMLSLKIFLEARGFDVSLSVTKRKD